MRLTQAKRAQMYKDVFNNPLGRQLLGDLLMSNYVFERLPDGTEWERGIAEGRRFLVLFMAGQVGFGSDYFPELMASGGEMFGEPMNG